MNVSALLDARLMEKRQVPRWLTEGVERFGVQGPPLAVSPLPRQTQGAKRSEVQCGSVRTGSGDTSGRKPARVGAEVNTP
jgi:hypothetical protein